jgi:hypothetical protein
MTPSARRWLLVALVSAVVAATPVLPRLLPSQASDLSAAQLRERIAASRDLGWSGEVRTRGSLQVPEIDSFGGVADLLGDDSTLRVWWRSDESWRVDRIRASGESDLVREGDLLTRWRFESERATASPYATVRLPDESDLVPARLARRMLAGAQDAELSRLPSRRLAGRSAPGLRLVPADDQSTIRRVDVWADARTGLPLRVEVVGVGGRLPVVTSTVTRLDPTTPDRATTSFTAPPGARVGFRDAIDVAAGANAFAPFVLPDALAGLERRGDPDELGAVGLYGRGPTALVAVPLRRRLAGQVQDQLETSGGAGSAGGTSLTVGPLSVLLTEGGRGRGTFLLAGTVRPSVLDDAAAELVRGVSFADGGVGR